MFTSNNSTFLTIVFFAFSTLALPLNAQSERELGAHNHGEALLNIVVEGDQLAMLMTSPAANIVGFEHRPETDAQKAAVASATSQLEDLGQVITFNSEAECHLVERSVHWHSDERKDQSHEHDGHDDEHGHKDHDDEHGHKDHDDEHEHKDHDDEHGHKDHDDEHEAHQNETEHSEFEAEYLINCHHINELEFATLSLFNSFPAVLEIRVEAILPSGQTLNILTPQNNRIEFFPR